MFIYSYLYYFRFFQILTCNSCFISNLQILLLMVSILREQNWWNLCHIFEEKKLYLWYNKPDYTPFFSYTIRAWHVLIRSYFHTTFTSGQSGKSFHCFGKSVRFLYVNYSTEICTTCKTDKSMSMIGWGIFR